MVGEVATKTNLVVETRPNINTTAEVKQKTNVMAILGLIFAFLFSLLGLIFSIIALNQIKKTGEGGKGLAKAGLIISIVFIAITVLAWIIVGLKLFTLD